VIALVRVELRRNLSRRILRLLGALALVGIVTGGVTLFVRSHHSTLTLGQAIQQADNRRAAEVLKCSRGEGEFPPSEIPPGQTLGSFCEQVISRPPLANPEYPLTHIRDAMIGVDGFLIVLFFVLGATFVGAEWHTGSMATLLTWEPRRVRVFVAKAAAAAIFGFAATLVVLAFLAFALLPSALFHGTTEGAGGEWLLSTLGLVVRCGALGTFAAVIGLAVASLGRNTAAALGAAFVYFVFLEQLIRGLRPRWQPWLLSDNVATFLLAHAPDSSSAFPRSPAVAALWLSVIAFAIGGISLLAFHRRDVT
jgi:ABC-type transport system involved in multi-copper enzyme maturation permease subunit